jgi:hypothetical protein
MALRGGGVLGIISVEQIFLLPRKMLGVTIIAPELIIPGNLSL